MTRLAQPVPLFLDGRGSLVDGGHVYVGNPGTDPEIVANRIPVFWDAAYTVPAAQPLRTLGGVIVNAASPAFVYFPQVDYSLKIKDADGNQVLSVLNAAAATQQFQPLDSDLTAIAALGTTPFGRGLLALADAAAVRASAGLGTSSQIDKATAAQFRANTADKALVTDAVWAAAAPVPLAAAGSNVAVNLSTGLNFTLAMTGGPWTLDSPTNAKPGQSGFIEVTQDATGGRVLSFAAGWTFGGGVDPVLSTAANAKDVLQFVIMADGSAMAGLVKARA